MYNYILADQEQKPIVALPLMRYTLFCDYLMAMHKNDFDLRWAKLVMYMRVIESTGSYRIVDVEIVSR